MKALSAFLLMTGLTVALAAGAEPFNDRSETGGNTALSEPAIGPRSDHFTDRGDDYLVIAPGGFRPAPGGAPLTATSVYPVAWGNS